MVIISIGVWLLIAFAINDVSITTNELANLKENPKYKYEDLFRADIGKEIKRSSFPIDLGNGLSLRYTKLKDFTIINKFDVPGYSLDHSDRIWDKSLKDIYKKDYCLKPYYKGLPIKLSFILFYEKDHRYVNFTKPLSHYCDWGNE